MGITAPERSEQPERSVDDELTDDYVELIARVEAMPENQSGADKSGRWRGSRAYAARMAARVTRVPRRP